MKDSNHVVMHQTELRHWSHCNMRTTYSTTGRQTLDWTPARVDRHPTYAMPTRNTRLNSRSRRFGRHCPPEPSAPLNPKKQTTRGNEANDKRQRIKKTRRRSHIPKGVLAAADSEAPNWGCVDKEDEDIRNGKGGKAAGGWWGKRRKKDD